MTKYRKVLVNYATPEFLASQRRNKTTGLAVGGFDDAISYHPSSLSENFRKENAGILSKARGGGYWLWKPYIILETLKNTSPGDVVFYCDSGSYFVDDVAPLIEIAHTRQDIVCFPFWNGPERHWTKRDAFLLMDCDIPKYYDSLQRIASFIVVKNTSSTKRFFKEFLRYACDERIITDQENTLGQPDYEGFKENRHDQSVFSLLTKKWGYDCYRNPASWPEDILSECCDSPYNRIIKHTRQRQYPWMQSFKIWIMTTARRIKRKRKIACLQAKCGLKFP